MVTAAIEPSHGLRPPPAQSGPRDQKPISTPDRPAGALTLNFVLASPLEYLPLKADPSASPAASGGVLARTLRAAACWPLADLGATWGAFFAPLARRIMQAGRAPARTYRRRPKSSGKPRARIGRTKSG